MLKLKDKVKQLDFIALKLRREKGGEETVCALIRDNRNTKLMKYSPLSSYFPQEGEEESSWVTDS